MAKIRITNANSTLELGTICPGTMKAADIMPALLAALDRLALSAEDRRMCDELQRDLDACSLCSEETELYDTLIQLAERYAPDHCYLGSHPGDGVDFGVWPCNARGIELSSRETDGWGTACWSIV